MKVLTGTRTAVSTVPVFSLTDLSEEDMNIIHNGLAKVELELDQALDSQGLGPNIAGVTALLKRVEEMRKSVAQTIADAKPKRKAKKR